MNTQLFNAAVSGDIGAVAKALAAGADINGGNIYGLTALMLAAGRGHAEVVQLLLNQGASVHILDPEAGNSALHHAAQNGNSDVVAHLLKAGSFINLQNPFNGHTPLIDAIIYKNPDAVKALLDAGANLNLKTYYGVSPSDYADTMLTQTVQLERAKQIRSYIDAEIARREEVKAGLKLFHAVVAENPDLEEIKRLIENGQDVNQVYPVEAGGNDGHTPLLAAARDGRSEIVRLLLDHGASSERTDGLFRAYPSHKAAFFGHTDALKTLLGAKDRSDLNVRGPANGYTPMHDAIWCGHAGAAEALLDEGAPFNIPAINGRTQLDLARIEFGADHPLVQRMEASSKS